MGVDEGLKRLLEEIGVERNKVLPEERSVRAKARRRRKERIQKGRSR